MPAVSDGINVDKGSFRRSEGPVPRTYPRSLRFRLLRLRRLTAMRELLFAKSQLRRCWLNARLPAFPRREREHVSEERFAQEHYKGVKCASPAVFKLSLWAKDLIETQTVHQSLALRLSSAIIHFIVNFTVIIHFTINFTALIYFHC